VGTLLKPLLIVAISLILIWSWLLFAVVFYFINRHIALHKLRKHVLSIEVSRRKLYGWSWLNRLQDQLIASRIPIPIPVFFILSVCLFAFGGYVGWIWFLTIKHVFLLGLLLSVCPWIFVRVRLINMQVRMRLIFLDAVEIFYQAYVSVPRRNIRVVLAKIVSEQRMPKAIAHLFREMHEQFIFGDDRAIHTFAQAISHEWGYTFTHLLEVSMAEGIVLDHVLQEFICDLRDTQKSALEDKTRLLEIRIANFSPPFFLALFIGINLHFNYEGAIQAYIFDLHGRILLLQAFLLMVASFVMGVWLSIQRT
jgi:hypothetical protein